MYMTKTQKTARSISVKEITYGQCNDELTIVFDETIQSVNLNKIILVDRPYPNIVTGFRVRAIQAP